MFDIGWSEILVIGAVALVVIGPKDLPRVLKTVGYWVRKARSVSREFQGSVEQMIREAELEDVKKEIEKVGSIDLKSEFEKTIDPTGDMKKSLDPSALPFDDVPPPRPAETDAAEPASATAALPPPPAEEPPVEAPISTPAAPVVDARAAPVEADADADADASPPAKTGTAG